LIISNNQAMIDKSESIKNLAAALLIFDAEVAKVGKTASNPFFKNRYAPLPEIQDAVKEPLLKAGLTVKQIPVNEHSLYTILIHAASGEYIAGEYTMKPAKDDPQGNGSRITYQRRYSLGAILGLNIDEDDDGNKASKQPDVLVSSEPMIIPEFTEAINKINQATTIDRLNDIYKMYKTFQKEKEFITSLAQRKREIQKETL
jgi:hypothetical protein